MKKIVSQLSAALLVGALVFTTSCKKDVVVTADKSSVAIGETVNFTALEADSKLKGTYITWDFGDGSSTTNNSNAAEVYNNNNKVRIAHAFNAAGTYTVAAIYNKSKRPTKKNGKTTYGTVDVTVNAVTPTFEINDASGAAVTTIMTGQELYVKNTTVTTDMDQASISYTWYQNDVVFSTQRFPAPWAPPAGKNTYKVRIVQGNTTTWGTPVTVTVGGSALTVTEMQAMIGGKWNVSSSATFSGAAYTNTATPCFASTTSRVYNNEYSVVYLNSSGTATWGTDAFPSNEAGNLVSSPGVTITVVNPTTVSVSGLGNSTGMGSTNGLYTTTVSANSMTLTRTDKGDNGNTSCPFSDIITITMSR